ncbi:hypothetical protein [Sedimentibacter sp. B4]|uniref:hypothetical protein n=1 Tax=Sedimentibacter sp. B4 TaxID=304766 RepID=UPI00031C3C3B|nr:hypothetical protein [Sedimentibacter sp. B4]
MKNFSFNENKNKNNNNNNNEKLFNWEEQAKLDSQQSFREQQKHMIDNLRNDNNNNRLDNRNDNNRSDNRNDNSFDNKDKKKIKRDNNQTNFR